MSILITGGCGYIGSHVVRLLTKANHKVVILDNFSTGFEALHVKPSVLVKGDCKDLALLDQIVKEHKVKTIIHFAASILVPESVEKPIEYYENNLLSTLNLIKVAQKYRIESFIFSSTAAVYGEIATDQVKEDAPLDPQNPYGKSKVTNEWMIQDAAKVSSYKYAIIRYFNVAGASEDLSIGPLKENATHLVRVASEFAVGKRKSLSIYGDNYKTPDGTAIRDYIHVEDIAQAHLDCLQYLKNGGASDIFNCGYGSGYSVKEVIDTFSEVLPKPLTYDIKPRRESDVEKIVASSDKLKKMVGWRPKHANLKEIIQSAIAWERQRLK